MKAEKPTVTLTAKLQVKIRELRLTEKQQKELQTAFKEALIHTLSGSVENIEKCSSITTKITR